MRDIHNIIEQRHKPKKADLVLNHDTSSCLCRFCGKRKPRTEGSTKAGRFVCFKCTGEV